MSIVKQALAQRMKNRGVHGHNCVECICLDVKRKERKIDKALNRSEVNRLPWVIHVPKEPPIMLKYKKKRKLGEFGSLDR